MARDQRPGPEATLPDERGVSLRLEYQPRGGLELPVGQTTRRSRSGVGVRRGFYAISREKPRSEASEGSVGHRPAHVAHQPQVEREVVERQRPVGEQLAGREQVAEVGPREAATPLARTLRVEGRPVAGEA